MQLFQHKKSPPLPFLKENEPAFTSFMNLFYSVLWVKPSIPEAISTSQGTRIHRKSIEKFKFRIRLKLANPLKNQGFFLVVPIILLSPDFIFKRFDPLKSRIILIIYHRVLILFLSNTSIGSTEPALISLITF